jgi:hypothetical protein
MLLTGITLEQIENLQQIFSVLTPEGWAIPEWLVHLEDTVLGTQSEIIPNER